MTHRSPKPAIAALVATLALATAVSAIAPSQLQASEASSLGAGERCYDATAGKRKTSLGVHQWTVRMAAQWCVTEHNGREAIVSVTRDTRVRTGTNWRLVSRSGGVEHESRRRAAAESRFHFRLRYPYFEQNCYPRVALVLLASGGFERSVRTGC